MPDTAASRALRCAGRVRHREVNRAYAASAFSTLDRSSARLCRDVVVVGDAASGMLGRQAGAQLGRSELPGEKGRPGPDVVGLLAQHVPDDHRELPRGSDGRDVLAATRCDPLVEGSQWSWRARGRPCCLDQHAARMATALLGDAAMISWSLARLAHARVEAEIGDKLLADRGSAGCRRLRRDAGRRSCRCQAASSGDGLVGSLMACRAISASTTVSALVDLVDQGQ